MSTFTVSNASELSAALAQAQGGDVVELASGHYGNVDLSNIHFNDYVTITSADGNKGAVFNSFDIQSSSYIRVDGVHVSNSGNGNPGAAVVRIYDDSHHVDFMNSEVNGSVDGNYGGFYGILTHHTSDVRVENNYIHDVENGSVNFSGNNLVVSENYVDYLGADAFKFAGVYNFVVENNSSLGHMYPSPGAHLDFIQFQNNSGDGVVRGNVFLTTTNVAWIQGIFLADGNYSGITIEDNVVYTGMANGIYITDGGHGNTVRNNTVLNNPNTVHNVTNISVVSGNTVVDNISASYTGGMSGSNIKAQHDDPSDAYYYGDLFVNAHAGSSITLADLAAVPGSEAETKGAYARIAELLGEGDPYQGNSGDDSIEGSNDGDEISGNGGSDELSGEGGNDVMYGGSDDDRLYGGDGNDLLDGGANDDRIQGGAGEDMIDAGDGHDQVRAGDQGDTVYGGEGKDRLLGNTGEDIIYGGEGKDKIFGGKQDDILYGGSERDVFVFKSNSGEDTIKDFETGLDKIHLRKLGNISEQELEGAISTDGDDAVVDLTELGGDGRLVIENVASELEASDFII